MRRRCRQPIPDSARAFAIHCFALARASRSEEAAQSCNRAISLEPGNADAFAYLALANYDIGRLDAATDAAQQAVTLNPNSIEGNTAYAFVLTSQQRYDEALEFFVRATQINPRLVFPYFNLGATALGMALSSGEPQMYQLSVDAYDTILSMNLRNVKAYTSLCQVYLATGERNLARDNCLTATELDATYTRAWRWLGEVYYRNMEYEQAIDAFDRCASQEQDLPADRRQPECWYYRGPGACADWRLPRRAAHFWRRGGLDAEHTRHRAGERGLPAVYGRRFCPDEHASAHAHAGRLGADFENLTPCPLSARGEG